MPINCMQWQNQCHFIDISNPSHYKTRADRAFNCCRSHTYLFLVFLVRSSWFLRNKVKLPASWRHLPCLYNKKTDFLHSTHLKPEPFFTYKMHGFAECPLEKLKLLQVHIELDNTYSKAYSRQLLWWLDSHVIMKVNLITSLFWRKPNHENKVLSSPPNIAKPPIFSN